MTDMVFIRFSISASARNCVSTSIPALLAQGASRELNSPGLAVFARLGFFLGEDFVQSVFDPLGLH
jgi:hypothetical protein